MSGSREALDLWHRQQQEAYRDAAAQRTDQGLMIETTWSKPVLSDAMGVHPNQIQGCVEDARKRGIEIEFAPDGRQVFRSRKARKEYCRSEGFHDNDGGYGDP